MISPPREKPCSPTQLRLPRPVARAKSKASSRSKRCSSPTSPALRTCNCQSPAATARASWVPLPRPTCSRGASTTSISQASVSESPQCFLQAAAKPTARSASGPRADSSAVGCIRSQTPGRSTISPTPPKLRMAGSPNESMPRCSRAGERTSTLRTDSPPGSRFGSGDSGDEPFEGVTMRPASRSTHRTRDKGARPRPVSPATPPDVSRAARSHIAPAPRRSSPRVGQARRTAARSPRGGSAPAG